MKYLDIESSKLVAAGGIHTATEISQQPELWEKVWRGINEERPEISAFLKEAYANVKRIVLTGAGTSAFIGLSLRGAFQRHTGIFTEVITTTDIVSHPNDYFNNIPTLMISFARSGNSPESVAAVKLADEICGKCYHLIVTCNADGALSKYTSHSNKYVYVLPREANDVGLAMTSSYTGMALTGLLIARIDNLGETERSVKKIIEYGRRILNNGISKIKSIAEKDFTRAVFLGSGPFFGTATEAHLKLQELTNGKVICKKDSFLGFRHGPKAVIDANTLVVYFFSNNVYAHLYERDLVEDMRKGTVPLMEVGVAESSVNLSLPYLFSLSNGGEAVEEEFLVICHILPVQILAFYKSLLMGLKPDSPSENGAISRVVQGVEIYVHSKNK